MPDQPIASTPPKPAAKPATPTVTEQPSRRVDEEGHVERHGRDGWLEREAWFPVRHARHALAGALYDVGPDELLTQPEVQARLDKFLAPRKADS